ncbi:MAG: tetratricopeptide repeat protein, partial [Myxococcota bacterium]
GPLARPDLALALLEREIANDSGLRERGLAAAHALGDANRELALLRPLVPAGLEGTLRPDLLRRLGLALARAGESGTAYTILSRAQALAPRDREVLEALETHARGANDDARLAELLAARFPLESGEPRQRIAAEAANVAARRGDAASELRWLRKLHALAPLARDGATRWRELERSVGTLAGRLDALRTLHALTQDLAEQAELEAAQGEVLVECGQLAEASACYARALAGKRKPQLAWLRAQSELLARLGRATERVDLLRMLASHPEAAADERARHQRERIDLLASHPELREEAALELRMLIDSDAGAARPAQLERMRGLLHLYRDLGRDAEWCALAERVHALSPESDRPALEREIAERLGRTLGSTDQAIAAWQRVLTRTSHDAAALASLSELLRRPGDEARCADVLEKLATTGGAGRERHWLEAARLRWLSLADASQALADVEQALAISPRLDGAHDLRSELCANLDRHTEEAASLRELLTAEPEGAQAADRWLRLAQLAAARAGSESEAIEAAERALALARGQHSMVREARRVFERAQAWERVRDLLREEIESATQGEAPALLRRLARVAWDELHDAELACEALAAVESSESLRTDDRERYAAALAERGLFAESFREREKVLSGIGDLATAASWLALARDVLERFDDPRWARELCDRALAREPRLLEALCLRIELHARLCEPARELEDVLAVAELESDPVESSTWYTRAAELARNRLEDATRAAALFRSALKRDPAHLPALLGAGEIALAREEWPEAERMLGLATSLLPGTPEAGRLGAVARAASRAALAQQRQAESYRYLELALAHEPGDPDALDAMATQALRMGAFEKARDAIDARLRRADLEPVEHADRLVKLAQACEGLQQLDRAAAALEEVLAIRPEDEVSRARAVDLLERLGESERAVLQLDAWSERAPAEFAARLRVRAAQLELAAGDRGRARARLEAITDAGSAPEDAWTARLEIARADDGPEATLALAERALASVKAPRARAAMLWLAAEANLALGRNAPAARRAFETLGCDAGHVPAARLLAAQLGQLDDWGQAVKLLERALDVAHPERSVESELWEAIGRAYAGPLEDIERAQRCYRRALECNPLRSSAREALADITAFDPAAHRESVAAHRELLARHPARRGSWRSLERIAEHWKRERAQATCSAVLSALGSTGAANARPQALLADISAPTDASIAAATELLQALAEAGGAPTNGAVASNAAKLQGALKREVEAIAGTAWSLPDASLRGIWSQPGDDAGHSSEDLGRRARRRLKRALRSFDAELLRVLEPEAWREQVLGQAAAKLMTSGTVDLRELLLELLECWPATAELQLRNNGDLAAGIQLCPPARTLLLRIGHATMGALGL